MLPRWHDHAQDAMRVIMRSSSWLWWLAHPWSTSWWRMHSHEVFLFYHGLITTWLCVEAHVIPCERRESPLITPLLQSLILLVFWYAERKKKMSIAMLVSQWLTAPSLSPCENRVNNNLSASLTGLAGECWMHLRGANHGILLSVALNWYHVSPCMAIF